MGNKLYVGGLPYSVTEGQLQDIFAAHGTVESAKVIADKFTGQSRGFGFVEMGSGGEAQKAIQALNFEGEPSRSTRPSRWKGAMVAVEIEETEAAADAIAGSFLSSTSQKVATGRVAIFFRM
jgi:RNA recognition motif-containing protein